MNVNNFALVCDNFGNITKIISEGEIERNFKIGYNLSVFIDSRFSNNFFNFLKHISKDGYVLANEMTFCFKNNKFHMNLSGFYLNSIIYIIALTPNKEISDILNDILEMNSIYVTQLRRNMKNYYSNLNDSDNSAYTEISKLNNELINSKRIIEQQNAKLLEYTAALEDLALKDPLTGAYNRRYLNKRLIEEIEKIKENNYPIVLASIDFDNFKMVNDKLGHSFGDDLLKRFVLICNEMLRNELDIVFRLGGDEFLIMGINQNETGLIASMNLIRKEFLKYTNIADLSYGLTEITSEKINSKFAIDNILREIDKKMYQIKQRKKLTVS